jgi:hypothetical protein
MKTHRTWPPHMSNTPLFNPYTPAGHATTLDHFDLIEEEAQADEEAPEEGSQDPAREPPPMMNRD